MDDSACFNLNSKSSASEKSIEDVYKSTLSSMVNDFSKVELDDAPNLSQSSFSHDSKPMARAASSRPVEAADGYDSGAEQLTSLLSYDDSIPHYILLYREMIILCVISTELLPTLYDLVDRDEREKIRYLANTAGPTRGTEELLRYIEEKPNCKGKWQKFVYALHQADYSNLAEALSTEESMESFRSKHCYLSRLVEIFAKQLTDKIAPLEILMDLKSTRVLNKSDYEQIEAETRQRGNMAGMVILIDRIWRREKNWFSIFLETLYDNNYKPMVKLIDEDIYRKLELKANRGRHTLQRNDSNNLLESPNSETDVKGAFCIDADHDMASSDPQMEDDMSVREDYASARSNPQISLNNLSPMPNTDTDDQSYVNFINNKMSFSGISTGENTAAKMIDESIPSTVSYNTLSPTNADDEMERSDIDRSMNSMDVENLNQQIDLVTNAGNIRSQNINYNDNMSSLDSVAEDNISDDVDDVEDETSQPKQPLLLRNYQAELAEAALKGKNSIIVAPTGSGKTHVAMKIIEEHMVKMRGQRIPKVAFLVEQGALAEQQCKQCQSYLACKVKVITGETQRTERLKSLTHWMQSQDILVVTAQILVNALAGGSVSIGDFSLLIFDECHHAHAKHSYNQIMIYYMDAKYDQKHEKKLPQIVGLTASVGVGRANTKETAVMWIETMMANMDAEELSTVTRYRADLSEHVNIPDQVVKKVVGREKDYFGKIINKIMDATEKYMKESKHAEKVKEKKVLKTPSERGSDQYTQWASTFWRQIAKINDEAARRFFNTCRNYLDLYNRALIIYNDAQAIHALIFIKDELKIWKDTTVPNETDVKMQTLFEKSEAMLHRCTTDAKQNNPKLDELKKMIIKAYAKKRDSRGIIFVKTRDLVKAIAAWMRETDGLKELNPVKFVGAQASSAIGGMTKNEQDEILQLFRGGKHKLIIATSVAEEGLDIQKCNLVVRYDHVTNEIAMVQSRGRGRADDSKYVVLAEYGRGTAEREEINMIRENLMNEAIQILKKKFQQNRRQFREDIEALQKKAKFERDLEAKNRKDPKAKMGQFELRCVKCSNFICMSVDVKKIQGAHHAALCDDIKDRVMAKKMPRPTFVDDDLQSGVGKLLCKECGSPLGNVSIYKAGQFPILKIDGLLIVDSFENRDVKKKWKNVPFDVPDLTPEDLQRRCSGDNFISMS